MLDTNDQSPKFEFSLYTKTVPEGTAAIGTVVTTVSASDADLGQNSKVRAATSLKFKSLFLCCSVVLVLCFILVFPRHF